MMIMRAPGMTTPEPSFAEIVRSLSPAQRETLKLISCKQFFRVTGGWRARGGYGVRTTTIDKLKFARLIENKPTQYSITLQLTARGQTVLAIIEQRAQA